jgi:Flp pilus assembly protein TadB
MQNLKNLKVQHENKETSTQKEEFKIHSRKEVESSNKSLAKEMEQSLEKLKKDLEELENKKNKYFKITMLWFYTTFASVLATLYFFEINSFFYNLAIVAGEAIWIFGIFAGMYKYFKNSAEIKKKEEEIRKLEERKN